MEDNKISISLNTVIIIAVIIGALILGLISFFIYNNMSNDDSESLLAEKDNIQQSEIIVDKNDDKEENDNSSTVINNSDKVDEQATIIEKPVASTGANTAKKSSKTSPASFGEWTLASKYASGNYVDVPVKVTNITRGATASKEVKDYCENGSSIYRYEDAKEGMEWAVIEYQVDLTKMEKDISVRMDIDIKGTGDNTSVKYNGYTYILSTMSMTSGYAKGKIVTCKFATTLPIGCTDYLIQIGSYSHTLAYIQGK